MKGVVKFFDMKKGFGFIQGEDGTDYFVHISFLKEGIILEGNENVRFKPFQNERGQQAKEVHLE